MTRFLLAVASASLAVASGTHPALAGVSVGHSGWEWGNPRPQGNTIRSLDFLGATGYAAGDFGTLLRTDDSGATWTAVPTGVTADLVRVQMIDADSLVVAGRCTVIRSDDSGASFSRLRWYADEPRCPESLVAFHFPTAEVGYVLTEGGLVYRTGNGGASWSPMAPVPVVAGADRESSEPADVFFPTSDRGFAATADGVYRTSDGGSSWRLVAASPAGIEALFFASPELGFAVGAASNVLKTIDGGETWSAETVPPTPGTALSSVRCAGLLVCLATIEPDNRLLRTADGGATWTVVVASSAPVLAVAFASASRAVSAGLSGAIGVSDDAGASWSPIGGALPGRFSRLRGASGRLAFAIGDAGALARTIDGGRSWTRIDSPTSEDLVDASFADELHGFVLDVAGSLFRTDDGGTDWELAEGPAAQPAQAVLAIDRQRVFLIGPRGVRRSLDAGNSFRPVSRRAVRREVLFDLDYAGGSLFAYGPTAIFASHNGGRGWKKVHRPDHRPLAGVDFASARVGFALGKGGRVWRTTNRGRRWKELLGAGTDGGTDMAFSNARDGYLAVHDLFFKNGSGQPDYVLRTSDGGRRWRPQLVANSTHLNSLLATPDRSDFLLAGDDELFATKTGGESVRHSKIRLHAGRRTVKRRGKVRVSGRLVPAEGGERVTVSITAADPRRRRGAIDWSFHSARVDAGGRFSTSWRVRQTSVFVAQWVGDGTRSGAGSPALTVRVQRR